MRRVPLRDRSSSRSTRSSGLTLGVEEATASVTMGATTQTTDPQAPVLVTQNWESNDAVTGAPTIQPNRLVVGHVAKSGDVEVFRAARAVRARDPHDRVSQPHGEGADFDLVVGKPDAPSLQSNPVGSIPVGSIPVEDGGSSIDNRSDALPPETLQDIPWARSRREHLGEPRRGRRGGAGRRRRRGGLLHDHGQRLQRIAQRRAVRPAGRADATAGASARVRPVGSRSARLARSPRPPRARRHSSSSTGNG